MTKTAFRWRCISYFFAAAAPAALGAISTAQDDTSVMNWVVAGLLAVGAGFAALRGLLDQSEAPPPPKPPSV